MEKKHCEDCSGIMANIKNLCKFKDKLEGTNGDPGTLGRIFIAIDEKMSTKLALTLMGVILVMLSTSFGLLYDSQYKTLCELNKIKTSMAVIEEKFK